MASPQVNDGFIAGAKMEVSCYKCGIPPRAQSKKDVTYKRKI